MSTTQKVYDVTSMRQLIDLNGDRTNFEITVKCSSESGKPFQVALVDQHTLDTEQDFVYEQTQNGVFEGGVRSNTNQYQNYFLAIKSEEPIKVLIEITTTDLPTEQHSPVGVPTSEEGVVNNDSPSNGFNWKIIITVVIIAAVVGLAYKYYDTSLIKTPPTPPTPSTSDITVELNTPNLPMTGPPGGPEVPPTEVALPSSSVDPTPKVDSSVTHPASVLMGNKDHSASLLDKLSVLDI